MAAPVFHPADEPTFTCAGCLDEPSGWTMVWCPGTGKHRSHERWGVAHGLVLAECQRRKDHAGHTYAERCGCWQTNPSVEARRRKLEDAKAAKQRGQR